MESTPASSPPTVGGRRLIGLFHPRGVSRPPRNSTRSCCPGSSSSSTRNGQNHPVPNDLARQPPPVGWKPCSGVDRHPLISLIRIVSWSYERPSRSNRPW